MNHKHIAPIFIAAGLIAAALLYITAQHTSRPSAVPAATSTATTTHATAKTAVPAPAVANTIPVPVANNETVLAAMQAYASRSSFAFAGENYPSLGFFVESIDGKKNANGFYWFLYINGKSSDVGASMAQVHPGDVVEWRYEKDNQ